MGSGGARSHRGYRRELARRRCRRTLPGLSRAAAASRARSLSRARRKADDSAPHTPDLIKRLLLFLAHQAGSEVLVNELAFPGHQTQIPSITGRSSTWRATRRRASRSRFDSPNLNRAAQPRSKDGQP